MQSVSTQPTKKRRQRWWIRMLICVCLGLLGGMATLYFRQHALIYHPRPYDSSYAQALPPNGAEIEYALPVGKQTAYYIPGRSQIPKRLWVAFCGNGSLALDWITILRGYPSNDDAFLLLDYPGYGKNAGSAAIASMRASTDGALQKLYERLGISEEQLLLCTIGHSLGAAVAFDFAAHHHVQRVVAISPFTTLREEAASIFGRPLSYLLIENYDNRANIKETAKRNPGARVAIFHGEEDEVVPVRMGRELGRDFPFIEFFAISGGDHVSVLTLAREKVIRWMNN